MTGIRETSQGPTDEDRSALNKFIDKAEKEEGPTDEDKKALNELLDNTEEEQDSIGLFLEYQEAAKELYSPEDFNVLDTFLDTLKQGQKEDLYKIIIKKQEKLKLSSQEDETLNTTLKFARERKAKIDAEIGNRRENSAGPVEKAPAKPKKKKPFADYADGAVNPYYDPEFHKQNDAYKKAQEAEESKHETYIKRRIEASEHPEKTFDRLVKNNFNEEHAVEYLKLAIDSNPSLAWTHLSEYRKQPFAVELIKSSLDKFQEYTSQDGIVDQATINRLSDEINNYIKQYIWWKTEGWDKKIKNPFEKSLTWEEIDEIEKQVN